MRVLATLMIIGAVLQASCATNTSAPTSSRSISSSIALQATPAVVLIKAYKGNTFTKQGSGFVIDSNGSIATNRHVIEDADSLKIQLSNGEVYDQVYVLADDARRDLALLRIPAKKLSVLRISDIEDVDVGDRVYVIGSPMGLQNTFTDGLVSAKRVIDGTSLIQISAPISPGSSGGPVLNEDGVVIGVATLSLKDAQNLNIAIPSRYVSGLLSISTAPMPFTEVAERFISSETPISENDDGQLEGLEPWAQSLVLQMVAVVTAAEKIGYKKNHENYFGLVKENELHTAEVKLDSTDIGKEIRLIAVCDSDCNDINLGVLDPNGNPVAADTEEGDFAEVGFIAYKTGIYKVLVVLPKCSTQQCGFAIQSYKK